MRECSVVLDGRRTCAWKDLPSRSPVVGLGNAQSGIASDLQIRHAGILHVCHVAEVVEITDRLPDKDR